MATTRYAVGQDSISATKPKPLTWGSLSSLYKLQRSNADVKDHSPIRQGGIHTNCVTIYTGETVWPVTSKTVHNNLLQQRRKTYLTYSCPHEPISSCEPSSLYCRHSLLSLIVIASTDTTSAQNLCGTENHRNTNKIVMIISNGNKRVISTKF